MICVIDSGVANISSVMFALQRIGCKAQLSHDLETITAASHVILPGVGHAQAAMQKLTDLNCVDTIKALTQPVLGICLGMQLLFDHSEEGDAAGLQIIPDTVTRLASDSLPIPHMGWNQITRLQNHPLLDAIHDGSYFYFIHSYAAPISAYTLASCDYGRAFSAIVQKDNFFGCQFHPERSGECGQRILHNFIQLS